MCCKFFKSVFIAPVLLASFGTVGFCQEKVDPQAYVASNIPDSLKENANSVVRFYEEDVTVKGPGKVSLKVHKVVTILNEKGDDDAILYLGYNKKYDSYSSIEMKVYDPAGNVIKKYHKSDMYDGAASDGFSLVLDDRFLGLKHTIPSYPETIETEFEEDRTSAMNLDEWRIQHDQQSVQFGIYKLAVDSNDGFKFRCKNIVLRPSKTVDGVTCHYTWQIQNLKATKLEEGAEAWRVLPRVDLNVKDFLFYGFAGDFSSWKSYGKWLWGLHAQVNTLTPDRAADIKRMTDTIKTDKGKAKFLYNYLQQNMRYVSIQLGIGGLQPFPASFVDQKKYGDCKALSNYMSAMLKAVNIDSYCAVINAEANKEPADPAFAFDSFNHEILCIPFKGDTTWLECTSNTQPFGKLGSFTENRNALLITEDGGKLVRTPRSTMQDNQFNSEAHITLDADGGAKTMIKILSTGTYREEYIAFATLKSDEQKEEFMRRLNIKQPISLDVKPVTDVNGVKEVDLSMEYDKFCDIAAGDKQFYRPHAFDLVAFSIPAEEHRKSDYYFETPLQKTCVTTIDLPAGFDIETLPSNQSLKFTYGDYDIKYSFDATKHQVVSTAKFDINNQVIPAAKYTELQEFLDSVVKAQNKKLVIKRKA